MLGPAGAYWLRARVEGEVAVRLGVSISGLTTSGDAVRIELEHDDGDTETVEVDHVIAATGYRFDVDLITMLDEQLREDILRVGRYPALSASLESSVEGLYFAGLAASATFGPLLRFVYGTHFASTQISHALSKSASQSLRTRLAS